MQADGKLAVGVIGLGVGEAHARAFAVDPRCRLVAVADLDEERAARVATELSARVAPSFDDLCSDPEIDILSIATYDDAHFAQALAGLEAGKHVFAEKPLCRTNDEVRALSSAWSTRRDLALASNLVLRAAPVYRRLEADIRAGMLGRVYAFDGDYLYGRVHKITEGWRKVVENYSPMLGGGVHLVDLMLLLVGEQPAGVTTVANKIVTAGTDYRYPDHVSSTFTFPSGVIGRVTANFGCVHPHQHVVRIFGTEGTFLCDDRGPRIHTSRDPSVGPTLLDEATLPASKGELIPWFVDAIEGSRAPRVPVQHEFDVISACIAADEALAGGGTVEIEYP